MPAILLLFFLLAFVQPVFAAEHSCAGGDKISGTVSGATGADWFALEGDPAKYFVADLILMAPIKNNAAVRGLQAGQAVEIYGKNSKPDRYGRTGGQVFTDSGWVQGKLLRSGRALVFGNGVSKECLSAMRKVERLAEQEKSGVWNSHQFQFAADDIERLAEKTGNFALIKGKVSSVGDRKRRLYLNFGQNWSQDFTVSVAKKGSGAFKGDVSWLAGLNNRTVRVRGILDFRQGPLIRLSDEAQIEVFD